MEEILDVLDKISKDTNMGMDAINYVMDKVEDNSFKQILNSEYNNYKDISTRVNVIYNKYKPTEEPNKTNAMNKMMTWSGVQMNTLKDHSNSKISELIIQGTNMGIISGRRILNNYNLPEDIEKILNDFVVMQEESVEKFKKYL